MSDFPLKELSAGQTLPLESLHAALRACGRNVKVFRGCRLSSPDKIDLGDFSQIDEGVHIFAGLGVTIGRHVHLAFQSSISGGGKCEIGDFAGIGAGTRIVTGTELLDGAGLTNPTVPPNFRSVSRGQVIIGPHAIIFTNCVVLPNVTIGEGAAVAAGSVIHHNLKPWGIYAGHPLVQVGVRDPQPILTRAAELLKLEGLV